MAQWRCNQMFALLASACCRCFADFDYDDPYLSSLPTMIGLGPLSIMCADCYNDLTGLDHELSSIVEIDWEPE